MAKSSLATWFSCSLLMVHNFTGASLLTVGSISGLFSTMHQTCATRRNTYSLVASFQGQTSQRLSTHFCTLACIISLQSRRRAFASGMHLVIVSSRHIHSWL